MPPVNSRGSAQRRSSTSGTAHKNTPTNDSNDNQTSNKGPNQMNIVKRGIQVNESAPAAAAGMTARQKFLNRQRFGGFDSADEEQTAQVAARNLPIGVDGTPEALPAEATLARV